MTMHEQMATSMPEEKRAAKAATFQELQGWMDDFVRSRGWYQAGGAKPQLPRNLATSIALEASEVLECFQWTEEADPADVGAELADVILYAAQLANVLGIDLDNAVAEKFELNESRWADISGEQWPRLAS